MHVLTFLLQITNGSATGDFVGLTHPIVFTKGAGTDLKRTVTFTTVNDTIPEADEVFQLRIVITRGTAVLGTNASASVKLLANDDAYGVFRIQSVSAAAINFYTQLHETGWLRVLTNFHKKSIVMTDTRTI